MKFALWALIVVIAACGTTNPAGSPTTADPATSSIGTTADTNPNVAIQTAGAGSCSTTPAQPAPYSLTAVTEQALLVAPLTGMHGHAAAWGDVDGDGFPDLYVGTFADRPDQAYAVRGARGPSPDRLLVGDGKSFSDNRTLDAPLGRSSGAAFADLDNDGDLDLVASRNADDAEGPRGQPTQVFRNNEGAFEAVDAGFDASLGGRSVGVLDYDRDGLLDLYIVEDRYRGGSSRLFRNMGELWFEDVTEAAGLPLDVNGLGVAVGNLGGDAGTDIFVSGSNRLFIANEDGFVERSSSVFDWDVFGNEDIVAGVDMADVDLDGRLDLVVGQHYNSTVDFDTEVSVRLYLNRSEGERIEFVDITEQAGLIPLPTKAPHVEFADMNNDGLVDIVTSASAHNGTLPAVFLGTGIVDGIPRFDAPDGLGSDQYWVTAPTADYNRDGRLDVFAVEWEPSLPSLLFSGAADGNWITIGLNTPHWHREPT